MPSAPLPVSNAPRRKPGRGSQVTAIERREIQLLHLVEGLGQKAIAARVGRTRETVAKQLKDTDFQMVKREVIADMAEEARSTLQSHVRTAAKDCSTASGIAAKKGDHRPAKELLLHAGVIERLGDTTGSQVTVVVGMPGHPAMLPPTQADREAARRKEEAMRADTTIDVTVRRDAEQARRGSQRQPRTRRAPEGCLASTRHDRSVAGPPERPVCRHA